MIRLIANTLCRTRLPRIDQGGSAALPLIPRIFWIGAALLMACLGGGVCFAASGTATTLAITAGGGPVSTSAPGSPVTLTATVTGGGAAVRPGTVLFCDATAASCLNGARLGTAQLNGSGTAALTLRLPSGPHSIRAFFSGTATYGQSSSTASTVTITGAAAPAGTLSFSGTQGNYTLSDLLTSTSGVGKSPTGTVSFQDTSSGNAVVGSASLLAGNSTGKLTLSAASLPTGSGGQQLAVGDLNNDGLPDVISVGTQLGIFLNNGDGTFTRKSLLTVGNATSIYAPAVGDFNGDGKLDIVVEGLTGGTSFPTELYVLLGNGDGTFTISAPIVPGSNYAQFYPGAAAIVGDFNGDGNLDLAVLESSGNTGTVGYFLLTGKGDGSFVVGSPLTVPGGFDFGIAAGDFNGDGRTDLAFSDDYGNSVHVAISNGDGTFTMKGPYAVGDQPSAVLTGDFNNDGILDIVTIDSASGQSAFLQGIGDGTFLSRVSFVSGAALTGVSGDVLAAGDFNGDGILDVVSSGEQGSNLTQVLQGNGDGTFTAQAAVTGVTGTAGAYGIAVADFNGDGTPDVAGINPVQMNVTVLLDTVASSATATATGISIPGSGRHTIDAVYPGDPLYAASTSNLVTLNVPLMATTLTLNSFPSTGPYGRSPTLLATLTPYNSGSTTTNGELLTFLKDGKAVGTGTLANGAATFSPGTLSVGASTFTVTYAGDNTFASSTSAATTYTVSSPTSTTTTTLSATSGGAYITSATLGSTVTYTANVKIGSAGVHPGQVRFCDTRFSACTGAGLLGTATLQANGAAVLPLRLGLGAHTVRAVFAGTGAAATSASAVSTVTILGVRATMTSLGVTGTAGNYTLSATVNGSGSATGPSGSVSFLDNTNAGAVIGTGPLGAATVVRSFAAVTSGSTGTGPTSLLTADFNGDGLPDTATMNAIGTVSVLLSAGDGTATVKTTSAVAGTGPFSLAAGDFNGDGIIDLAAIGQGSGATLTVLLGKGDGTFAAGNGPAAAGATAMLAGDFTGDGVLDLAVATSANTVVTLAGNGDGTFTTLAKVATTGNLPSALASADLNADGTLDLAVANLGDNTVTILLNNGDGTFQPQSASVATGSHPSRLLLADLNADGFADLITVNSGDGTLSILLGAGNGTFALKSTPAVGANPNDASAFDFTGDGVPDLVVAGGAGSGTATLLAGKGDGTFSASTIVAPSVGAGATSLAVADFNGDGLLDFAAAGSGGLNSVAVALQQIATSETATLPGVGVPGAGSHSIVATYPGDTLYGTSTSSAAQVTGSQVTASLKLATSTPYNSFGQAFTLTATLAPYAVGVGNTNGETVTFLDAGVSIGTGTLSNGVATLSLSTLAVGRHSLTASYLGDTYFLSAVSSPAVPYRVSAAVAPTTTALSLLVGGAAVTKTTPGTIVTLMATVTGLGHGITPGTINFCDATAKLCVGSALFGSAQLNSSGVATLQHVFGVGSYQVTARFAGDTNYGISSSATASLSVPGNSITTLGISGMPGSYTFTGTVATQGSLAAPAGTVSFVDTTNSNSVFATATLSGAAITQSFATPTTVTSLPTPFSFVQGDFNHDGKLDVVYTTSPAYLGQNSVLALLSGNGDGTFKSTAVANPGGGLPALALGDFNNDGNLDFAAAGTTTSGASALVLFAGKGDGTFAATDLSSTLPSGGVGAFSVQTTDFNGDGNLDLLFIDTLPGSNNGGDRYTILLGKGDGTFTVGTPFFVSSPNFVQALNPSIADFNRDGIPDFAFVGNNTVSFYAGNGDGTFAAPVVSTVAAVNTTGAPIVVADENGDGILDLVSANYLSNYLTTLIGKGDGTFSALSTTAATGGEPQYMQTADFNGDGIPDVAVTNYNDGTVSVLTGKGDGTFNKQVVLAGVAKPTALLAGDYTNDGLPDIFDYSQYGTFADVHANTASYSATATASNVSVPGTGIHYVDASYAGSAAYGAGVSGTRPVTATPVVVAAPTAQTTLTLGVNPTGSSSGQSVTFTATLTPASGSVTAANGETVTFLNNNLVLGTGVLTNGVASFTTAALRVGKNSISATYNGDSSLSATVSAPLSFTVVQAAAAVSLSLTSGGQAVTSSPINTTVTLAATVKSGTTLITQGTVLFCDTAYKGCFGQGLLGTGQLNAQGVATFKYRFGAGVHVLNAVFLAQKNYVGGTSPSASLSVTGGTTQTTLASAGTQGNYTLTATVAGSGPLTGPTGTVGFYDTTNGGNALLGSTAIGSATQARTFVPGPLLTLPTDIPTGTAVVDLNNDGIPDLLTLTTVNAGLAVQALLGTGTGSYGAGVTTPVTGITQGIGTNSPISVADFNGDGIPDVAVSGGIPGSVSVLLGNGDGSFRNTANFTPTFSLFGAIVMVADFNGDGLPDVATVAGSTGTGNTLAVYLSKGDGTFTATAPNYLTTSLVAGVAGDFNSDGHADIALIDGNNTFIVYLGNGDGTFTQKTFSLKNNAGNTSNSILVSGLVMGDFNGDGIIDLASSAGTGASIDILLGNGDGTFAEQPSVAATGLAGVAIGAGDLNGDGLDDLATAGSSSLTYLFSNGDGTFTPQPSIPASGNVRGLAIVDANGDGQPDIVLANSATDALQVIANTVTETAIAYLPSVSLPGGGVHTVDAVYPGDTLFAGSTSPAISLNGFVAVTTTLQLSANMNASNYGGSVMLTATLTPSGAPGTNGDNVTFLSASSSGSRTLGTAILTGGTATLSVSNLPAGTDTVTAVFAGDKTYGTSTSNAVQVIVTQASSSVTYTPATSQVYGVGASAAGILNATGTPSGGTAVYTAVSANGTSTTLSASTTLPVGTYSLTATYTPADTTDYAISSKTVSGYTVTQATPILVWSTPATIAYGTQLTAAQLNATSAVAGAYVYSPAAGAVLGVGSQKLGVTFTPTDAADYTSATASVTLQVTQATPVITWQVPAPIAFGTALSSTQLNASSTVPGSFVYSPPAGTVLSAGPHTITATFTPTDAVDYTTATATVTVQVGTVAASLTWPAPASISYGTALSGTQLNATANTAGTFVYSPAAGVVLTAGMQTLNVTFTPADLTTYTAATGSTAITVTKATSTLSATPNASPINPGSAEIVTITVPSVSAAALNPTGTVTVTDGSTTLGTATLAAGKATFSTTALTAGTHTLTITYPGDSNYAGSSSTVSVVVNAVAPDFTFASSGPVAQTVLPGGTASYNFSVAPTLASYPSTVQFSVSGLPAGAAATFSPGTLAAASGAQSVTLTVTTAAHAAMLPLRSSRWEPFSVAFLFVPLLLVRRGRLARRLGSSVFVLLLSGAVLLGLTGCGSQTGFFIQPQQSYTLTVVATSGATQHTATVSLNVQ